MKKFMSAGIIAAFSGMFLCGCAIGDHIPGNRIVPSAPVPEEPVVSVEENIQQGESKIIQAKEGVYIYDKAGTLSKTEYDECTAYAEMLYKDYLLNVGVVITDDLEGMTVDQYAAEAYNDLYSGIGSGMLLLINNDTNNDLLYKTGHCQRFIDDVSERDELYHATTELAVDNYKEAILIMLKLGEKCPKNVIDNSNIFSEETAKDFSASVETCADKIAIAATNNNTDISNEELAKSYYSRRFSKSDGYVILLDKKTKTLTAVTSSELPADKAEIIASANALAASNDFIGAIEKLITDFGGELVSATEPEEEETDEDYYSEEDVFDEVYEEEYE